MKIAIDISPLQSGHKNRGVGFYTKNLVEALGDKVEAVDFKKTDLSKAKRRGTLLWPILAARLYRF